MSALCRALSPEGTLQLLLPARDVQVQRTTLRMPRCRPRSVASIVPQLRLFTEHWNSDAER